MMAMLRRQKDTDAARRKKTGRPIFRTIFNAMMLVTLVEVVLLAVSIAITNVDGRLNQNAKDMLNMQVRNRVSYVQDLMQDAQNLTDLSEHINNTVLAMQEEGQLDLAELNTSREKSDALLTAIAPKLVSTLRAKPVSGIFVVLNTVNLHNLDVGCGLPGIYLRDLDPDARPSEDNADLMIERGSSAVVKKLGITTDKSWQPTLRYYGLKGNGFFKTPFQTAWEDGARLNAEDYGRWTTSVYKIGDDSRTAIAYSQPLILPDGTIYGVVGVELLASYLQTKLPYSELQDGNTGTYFLVSTTADEKDTSFIVSKAVTSSEDVTALEAPAGMMNCELRADECWLTLRDKDYYAVALPITLYSRNAPFSNERWLLIGTVKSKVLFAFADNVRSVIAIAIAFTLVLGALGSLVVARNLAHPVELLYHEVVDGQEKKQFPQLSHTNIRELDRLADALTSLNSELLNNSTKFLRIMDMASVELGGYELRFDTGSVYVTDNFFALLGASQPKDHFLSVRRFEEKLSNIQLSHPCTTTAEGDKILTIRKEGETRYIMLRVTNDQTTQVGLAEDVTAATLERMRIEHERDYDILTGLYNRQAFHRVSEELFHDPHQLGVAALMMMDLDNLKHINDTYGHDWGDQYIRQTGQCFAANTPASTICSRLSGDEFLIFFYGYQDQAQLRAQLELLSAALQRSVSILPNGKQLHISISGGVAWYPEDGRDIETLKKYADFAMYQVKHSRKGEMKEFDIGMYNQEAYALQTRNEFEQMLRDQAVSYHFQPIFSARNGRAIAYEALMRPEMPTLRSPLTVMKLARELNRLYDIEHITLFKASSAFEKLKERGLIREDSLLFINSIASVSLNDTDWRDYRGRFPELARKLVVEITEEEELDPTQLERKRTLAGASGVFALDDYGSGYSNGSSLLTIAPRYVKVDISIIRSIDTNTDKQQFLTSLVDYARPRNILVLAEGVETTAELRKVLELGVDLLQGYCLARPAAVPPPLSKEAADIIHRMKRC